MNTAEQPAPADDHHAQANGFPTGEMNGGEQPAAADGSHVQGDNDTALQKEVKDLLAQIAEKDQEIHTLQRLLAHWRNWSYTVFFRYMAEYPERTRPARRTYIGGLPDTTTESDLKEHLNDVMCTAGASVTRPSSVLGCKVYPDKNYAFVEFGTVEEASNCMALDGVKYKDSSLRIRRPNNYDSNFSIVLGPNNPNPSLDLDGLTIVRTAVPDSQDKLFIGGLPCDWDEDKVKKLLTTHGVLSAFNLVMDRTTGKSRGFAFCEYSEPSGTQGALQHLDGTVIGQSCLTVKRAHEH